MNPEPSHRLFFQWNPGVYEWRRGGIEKPAIVLHFNHEEARIHLASDSDEHRARATVT